MGVLLSSKDAWEHWGTRSDVSTYFFFAIRKQIFPKAKQPIVAKYTSERSRNVQIRSSVIYQAANGSPKRLPMAPRTVLGPGYTGWCLACLEAAVVSTGGRSRTPPVGSHRARRTAHSTLQQAIVG